MAPPGGRSNNIFGGYEEEKKTVTHGTNGNAPNNGSKSPVKPDLTAHQIAANNKYHNVHGTNIFGYDEEKKNSSKWYKW